MILGNIKAQIISIESGALLQGSLDMPVGDIKMERPEVIKEEIEEEEEEVGEPEEDEEKN